MRAGIETKPRRLGNYTLGRRIGAGGMAAVFAARQDGLGAMGRLVALKVMSTALIGNAEYERLFIREAGIATRLEHRNIVRVYEVGEVDGTLFIAMEYVHGQSVAELRSETVVPPRFAIQILAEVALALQSAHDLCAEDGSPLGLVHQDVSPHNVMVTYEGVVKLLDFGVARIGATDASRTETIRGKPAYLAPEQLNGEHIDQRTDVFALGIMMFELLSGTRLFQRSTALATYRAVADEPIPRLDSTSNIPSRLADVCAKALARDPEERFATAELFREELLAAAPKTWPDEGDSEDDDLGSWVRNVLPPQESAVELERSLLRSDVPDAGSDVADLPTLAARRLATEDETDRVKAETVSTRRERPLELPPAATKRRRSQPLLMAILATVLAVVLWQVNGSGPRVTPSPAPRPSFTANDLGRTGGTSVGTTEVPTTDASATARTPTTKRPASSSAAATTNTKPRQRKSPPRPATRAESKIPQPSGVISSATLPQPSASPSSQVATATPKPAPAPQPQGTLGIRSVPYGSITINGRNYGNSPKRVQLPPGRYTVTVTTPQGQSESRSVLIKAGAHRPIMFSF